MSQKLKILFLPMDAYGHINACLGMADIMAERGHEICFMVAKEWKQAITVEDYRAEVYEEQFTEENDLASWGAMWKVDEDPNKSWAEKELEVLQAAFKRMIPQVKARHNHLEKFIETYQPDAIILDSLTSIPAVEASGIPYIYIWSANPIRMYNEHCPPADSGLPTNSDRKLWDEFDRVIVSGLKELQDEFERYLKEKGVVLDSIDFLNTSPYLNIYPFPEELDYTDVAPPPKGWFRVDGLIRKPQSNIEVPEKFLRQSGKKIYLSLGSLGSSNVKLMEKLIATLAKASSYPVIISLGPYADKYKLADNMMGQKFVNQLKVLPAVDLVITHGGNNTVLESLYFGKPMIILPLFGDQPDNAQRLQEKGLGIRLDTFTFTENQLLDAIDKLMHNDSLQERLAKISHELQNSKRGQQAAEMIERFASKQSNN